MNKTIKFLSTIALLSTSQLMAMDQPTETPVEKCKTAFKEIETHNGASIWQKNLIDHCSGTTNSSKSCFYVTADQLPADLSQKGCRVESGNANIKPPKVAQCNVICDQNIGVYVSKESQSSPTDKIYFTIQNATNNKGYKYLIFNIYPQG